MSKVDAEIIKMLLWLILLALSTNPSTEAIAFIGIGLHAIAATFAIFLEVDE